MSDHEDEPDPQDIAIDDYAHQACYIFKPLQDDDLNDRPKKRRKKAHTDAEAIVDFPLLCNGAEPAASATIRRETLRQQWDGRRARIDRLVADVDTSALKDIVSFVNEDHRTASDGKLHTGLIVSGPDTTTQTRLLNQWRTKSSSKAEIVIELRSSASPNLQTALRNIIRSSITAVVGADGYTAFVAKHKRLIPMNFDLDLLKIFVETHKISKVVVSVLDVETFETGVLSELLSTLGFWVERIPCTLLLGIATTVALFESRLSKSVIRLLKPRQFLLPSPSGLLYQMFSDLQTSDDTTLFMGSSTLRALDELVQTQGMTIDGFSRVLQYAHMSHFFANPLSVLLNPSRSLPANSGYICEAIRNTNSFQKHCEKLLEAGQGSISIIKGLLDDDQDLLEAAFSAITEGQSRFRSALEAVKALVDLNARVIDLGNKSPFLLDADLYLHLRDLTTTAVFDDTIVALEKLESTTLVSALEQLNPSTIKLLKLGPLSAQIQSLQAPPDENPINLTPGTTLSNMKSMTLSKSKSTATKAEQEYTSLLNSMIDQITANLHSRSFDRENTLLHEAFIFNSRHLLHDSFTPRPRFVLERALGKPGDYLGCQCCQSNHQNFDEGIDGDDLKVQSSPATTLLYSLFQEAGTIINVRDLFEAFSSRLFPFSSDVNTPGNGEDGDEEENDEENEDKDKTGQSSRLALSLFYRSLSEMKLLGMVKGSSSAVTKKRALVSNGGDGESGTVTTPAPRGRPRKGYADIDFVAKTGWGGL